MKQKLSIRSTRGVAALIAASTALAGAPAASAGIIQFQSNAAESTEGLGAFTGSLEFASDIFTSTGTLTVSLTNTSPAANGGFLTGFVFNFGSDDPDASASLTGATHPFMYVSNEPAPPFGTYNAGAALGSNWSGGGSPNAGIGVGDTGVFQFMIEASDVGALSAAGFLGSTESPGLVVRFRGFEDGGSDKVPGMTSYPIPAPAAMSLLLLAGLAGGQRRRRA